SARGSIAPTRSRAATCPRGPAPRRCNAGSRPDPLPQALSPRGRSPCISSRRPCREPPPIFLMRRVHAEAAWPESWKLSYAYDLEEVYGEATHRGYANAYRERRRHTLNLVTEALAPGSQILDIAAAQGNFSIAHAEMGTRV